MPLHVSDIKKGKGEVSFVGMGLVGLWKWGWFDFQEKE